MTCTRNQEVTLDVAVLSRGHASSPQPLPVLIPHRPPQSRHVHTGTCGQWAYLTSAALACVCPQANLLEEEEGGSHEDFSQLLRDFEQWLQTENSRLVRIIAMRTTTATDLRTRETKLQVCSQGASLARGLCTPRCVCHLYSSNREHWQSSVSCPHLWPSNAF